MSTRTLVRDVIVQEFDTMKRTGSGTIPAFEVSQNWLTETEAKQSATYCVVVTDETRLPSQLDSDQYELAGAIVIYARDTNDVRAKLDSMIEDALAVVRRSLQSMQPTIERARIDTVSTSEATTAEGPLAQAVIRFTIVHRRAIVL